MLSNNTWLVLVSLAVVGILSTLTSTQEFKVKCDFGNTKRVNDSFSTVGELTSHFGNARSCQISHNLQGIVRVRLSKESCNVTRMFVVVMDGKEITFVGSVRSQELIVGTGYHFHACPAPSKSLSASPDLELFVFGSPENGTFNLDINLDKTSLSAGENEIIEVQRNGMAQVLSFDVDDEHLFKLLQVSVESDDDAPANLIVSQSCAQVQAQGIGMTTHNQNQRSIFLSFSRYGRITLSQYSVPKIQRGRWYVGVVMIKNVSIGSVEKKVVNVSVMQTYNYDTIGKGLPVLYMCLITGIIGIVIAIFAHFFLNSDFERMSPPYYVDDNEPIGEEGASSFNLREQFPRSSILELIPDPIPRWTFPWKTWLKVISVQWFCRGSKTYSYLTVLLAISFLVGSAQFVIGRWSNMIQTGDRDACYYNERCYRPIAFADLPSNFMISNVPYCLHGVFLAIAFSFREAICMHHRKKNGKESYRHDVPFDFSLAYALSWALLFEGLFSATYHLCPSRLTFQFDSAFMFIISGLVVVALFNARIYKIKNGDVTRPPHKTEVQAPKYFLFFVAPLLVLNYIGSIRDTSGLPSFVEGLYWVFLVLWLVIVYLWAARKVGVVCCVGNNLGEKLMCSSWEDRIKWFWLILVPVCLFIIGMRKLEDWSQFFLFSCIAAVVLAIAGLLSLSLVSSFKRVNDTHRKQNDGDTTCDAKEWCLYFLRNTHRIIYVIVMFLFWVFAMYFFKLKPTARKVAAPSVSRTYNDECVLWDFFDYHDIWHMLSSIALYMSAFLLIYITRSVEKQHWVEAIYWRNHEQNGCTNKFAHESNQPVSNTDRLELKEIELDEKKEEKTKKQGKALSYPDGRNETLPKKRPESLV